MNEEIKKVIKFISKIKNILILLAVVCWIIIPPFIQSNIDKNNKVSYKNFITMVESKNVKEINIDFNSAKFEFVDKDDKTWITDNPRDEQFKKYLLENDISVTESSQQQSPISSVFFSIVQILFFVLLGTSIINFISQKKGMGKFVSVDVTKSKKSKDSETPEMDFSKVAGNVEVKEEMAFLVEFLKNPKKYSDMGGKIAKRSYTLWTSRGR